MGAIHKSSSITFFESTSLEERARLIDDALAPFEITRSSTGFLVKTDAKWISRESPGTRELAKVLSQFCTLKLYSEAFQLNQALQNIESSRVGLVTKFRWAFAIRKCNKTSRITPYVPGNFIPPSYIKVRGIKNPRVDCFLFSLFQVFIMGIPEFQRELSRDARIQEAIELYLAGKDVSMTPLRKLLEERRLKNTKTWLAGQHDPQETMMQLMRTLPNDSPLNHLLTVERIYKKMDGYVRPVSKPNASPNWGALPISFWMNEHGQPLPTREEQIYFEDMFHRFMSRDAEASENCRFDLVSEDGIATLPKIDVPLEREITRFDAPLNNLILTINRFTPLGKIVVQNEKKQWVNVPVVVPEYLSLDATYFANGKSAEYELGGFIIHEGLLADSGHCLGCVSRSSRDGNKEYFGCNDNHVKQINQEEYLAHAQSAYILHYRKIV
jgi:hypothetical protein